MPKNPQDHKPKAAKAVSVAETRTVEVQGLALDITLEVFDDFELLDKIHRVDTGEPGAALMMPEILRAMVGAAQYQQVLDHLRDPDTGRVRLESGAQFIADLMAAYDPNS